MKVQVDTLSGHSCRPVDMHVWETVIDASPNRDIQHICRNSQVKYLSSWLLYGRETWSRISENLLVWIQFRLQIRHTHISVSAWRTPGIINVSKGRQRIGICGQIQCVRKVAVHLGYGSCLYLHSWTSLPTTFIRAQRLSERRSAESVCE
jgi:hypothetical protein